MNNLARINLSANSNHRPRLAEVYPPFREKIAQFNAVAESDPIMAAGLFAEAQAMAKAFWAGVDYACGVEQ